MGIVREYLIRIKRLRRAVRWSKRFTKALWFRAHRIINLFDPMRRTECSRDTTRCGDDFHSANYGYWYLGRNTPVCCTTKLVEILFWLVDILDANGIPYFILWGTHLGAVRHKGLIPWDFDVDIGVEARHERKILDLVSERCKETGYHIVKNDDYVIRITFSSVNYQHVDIELWYDDDEVEGTLFTHTFYGKINIPRNEVYPLAHYKFYDRTLSGPKEDAYLRKTLGDNIYTHGYRSSDLTDDREFLLENHEPARIRTGLPQSDHNPT
jgi:hypothetical protein